MNIYHYKGPISRFGIYLSTFSATTKAFAEKEALDNIANQAEVRLNLFPMPFLKLKLNPAYLTCLSTSK